MCDPMGIQKGTTDMAFETAAKAEGAMLCSDYVCDPYYDKSDVHPNGYKYSFGSNGACCQLACENCYNSCLFRFQALAS